MNICLIGNNLTSLIVSKLLINNGAKIDFLSSNDKKYHLSNRTIGISKSNIDFINNNICPLKKLNFEKINRIKIYSDNKKEIFEFQDNDFLFSMFEIKSLYGLLINSLKKNKNFRLKLINRNFLEKSLKIKSKYDLIINCEKNNFLNKKYFYTNFKKNYANIAYTFLLHHKNVDNFIARQIFTNQGPIAFLPLSKTMTSVVFSQYGPDLLKETYLKNLISKYNLGIKVKKFSNFEKAYLNFSSARKYYDNKILNFGDSLHQIHPLAGQGFNMTLRDLKVLLSLVKKNISLGLPIDQFLLNEFENLVKSKNTIFSFSIDAIYNFFKIKKNLNVNRLDNFIKFIGQNQTIKRRMIEFADKGLLI